MKKDFKFREIPYNYTSFSDKEIVLKYFDEDTWDILDSLRNQRVTGRSARLFFEILGDIFIIDRNPYIFNDILENRKKRNKLKRLHRARIDAIEKNADNPLVFKLIEKVRDKDRRFFADFSQEKRQRKKIFSVLSQILSRKNIHFSAFHKVSHVTDATDWRVEYPEVVVYPENVSEIIGLVRSAKKLNLKIIPRGGGTGLTGGAIPVEKNTMVINTEKMRGIGDIETVNDGGINIPLIEVEAGVVTESVTDYCKERGYIFATDPTSAWASTIGGNIAENCGGKKAVMWGTAIDNLHSFRIVNALGQLIEVRRRNHPYRKIDPDEDVTFDIYRLRRRRDDVLLKSITIKGTDIRKKGIGKDITNKALGGVPGIQKEGGDGLIVSARFVLYTPFDFVRTICMEFFGNNLINASKAIIDIKNFFQDDKNVHLTALEHFDEKYVIAINYRNKSDRGEIPKAILLVDIESNNESELDGACDKIINAIRKYNLEAFVAKDEETRELFWKDRKNLGAIARHTNAFKLNEDVVIPIESLPDFADFIEKLNFQRELENNLDITEEIKKYIASKSNPDDHFFSSKVNGFLSRLDETAETYRLYLDNIDSPARSILKDPRGISDDRSILQLTRDNVLNVSIDNNIVTGFRQAFHGYDEIINGFNETVADLQSKKIIIATHMHAGDGNVHVNIPVFSNDYRMLQKANDTAGIIMKKTTDLGGVISGEHGIGLTKLKFISQDILDEYAKYKHEYDPEDLFNPGKLRSNFPESVIYTPSLNLLEMEAFILEAADLNNLTVSISPCIRCGKCKEVCNTHYPSGTMFYSPRNKILGVSLITEAVLYEVQTQNTLSFKNFKMLREISDHCTMCHNCLAPCPVSIDFGDVTLSIRDLLVERKRTKFKLVTNLVLFYLKRRGYLINKIFRFALLKGAYTAQRIGYYLNKPFSTLTGFFAPKINSMLKAKLPKSGSISIREALGLKGTDTFFSFYNPDKPILKSVVYFPGCGSERLFSEISISVISLLYNAGIRVVIPPEYLCCGYPFLANGKVKQAETKSNENRVILHRMAAIIGYMGIEDVVVSCGTCYEMLGKYSIENIFPNSSIIDVNEFIARENLYRVDPKGRILYHNPCHSPLKQFGVEKTFKAIFGVKPVTIPNCCGEGGTLSLSTPDIANSLRERKKDNITVHLGKKEKAVVITTCPSCVQGLNRINNKVSVTGKALSVYLAEELFGQGWKRKFLKEAKKSKGIERIIL